MFQLHTAIALGLIALVAGTALWMLSGKEGITCKTFGRVISIIVMVVSILTMLCATYYGIRYWEDGYFRYPHGMTMPGYFEGGHPEAMKEDKMECCGMMKEGGMMKGMMKESPETSPNDSHEGHH